MGFVFDGVKEVEELRRSVFMRHRRELVRCKVQLSSGWRVLSMILILEMERKLSPAVQGWNQCVMGEGESLTELVRKLVRTLYKMKSGKSVGAERLPENRGTGNS